MIKTFYILFSIAIKIVIMFTNVQDICQIICRNVQALK